MKHLSNLHAEGEQLLTPFFNLADEGIHKYTFFILSIHKSHLYLKIKDADSGHQFVKDVVIGKSCITWPHSTGACFLFFF